MSMVNIFAYLVLCLTLVASLVLGGCAKSTPTSKPAPTVTVTAPAATVTVTATPPPAPKPAPQTYTLNVISAWDKTHPANVPLFHLVDAVNAKVSTDDGKVQMVWKGGPETIKAADLINATTAGSVDFWFSGSDYYVGSVPETAWAPIPVGWDFSNVSQMWGAGIGDVINKGWQKKGITMLDWAALSSYRLFTVKPFTALADLKGRQLRVPGASWSPITSILGVSPVSLAAAEVYGAMQKGTIDGGIQTLASYTGFSYWEVAPNLLVHRFVAIGGYYNISSAKFDALPAGLRDKLVAVVKEEEAFNINYWKTMEDEWEKTIVAKGGKLIAFPAADEQKLKQDLRTVVDAVAKNLPAEQTAIVKPIYDKYSQ
ncbi:MAG: TRAP transporter substrate-binding protein DctP [Chloroflexi bacterium]|nr:TRAP transporter substrate-binding protein DctP [Chloroflexota bacterium]